MINMDLEKDNIRLQEQNMGLLRENEYLRMLLDRFIPIPINGKIESLEERYENIDKRVRKIENKGNEAIK